MKRTLFLHVGSHRTATTSIQKFMKANFDQLIDHGVFYPYGVARHIKLINSLFSREQSVADVAAQMTKRADGKRRKITKIVLSDEDISTRDDPSLLAKFKDHFDVKVIFSIRRQDIWLESWYFQNIKWQWNPLLSHCTFDEFLAQRDAFRWIDYDRYLTRLEKLFGKENIHLTVFEKPQMPGGPVVEFCRQIGIDDLSGFTDPPHVNSSMSAETVEFIRHLPLGAIRPRERDLLRIALEQLDSIDLGNTGKQSERLMPPDQRRAVLSEYADGNRRVAQRYFGRDELFLEPLPADDAPLAELKMPANSEELMQRFVGPLLLRLVENGTLSAPATEVPAPRKKTKRGKK